MSEGQPQTYDGFYARLYALWHQHRQRGDAAEHFRAGIDANPEFLDKLKAAHAAVAQVVAARGLQCDNGIAATYTMLQSLFDQFPEVRDRRWQTTPSTP